MDARRIEAALPLFYESRPQWPVNVSGPEFEYKAFISYSHQDRRVAAWLHRAIESYRLPRRLSTGPAQRLKPIFRDRDELTTSPDLGDAVRDALRQSEFLIVLCSPAAAASRWVNAEIREFQVMRGISRIVPVIVAGTPHANDPLQACFPEALTSRLDGEGRLTGDGLEPLAADLTTDGRRRTKLKIVSRLLDLKLDQLVQRDHQRHNRRLMAIATASSIGLILTTALAVFALNARDDAQWQRQQAESLIEFMLTDLRGKLEAVGRLDVLDAVGVRAREYYASQSPESLDNEALSRNSRALLLIGEIQNLGGNLDTALSVFSSAYETTGELLKRAPLDNQRRFDHAQSAFWVGYLDWQRGHTDDAYTAFREYEQLANDLVATDPSNPDWQVELGHARRNLGVLLLQQRRNEEAEQAFRASLLSFQRASEQQRDVLDRQLQVGQGHAWLADVMQQDRRFDEALRERQLEREIYQSVLTGDTDNRQFLDKLAVTTRKLGVITLALGDVDSSRSYLTESVQNARQLIQWEPENTLWMEFACSSMLELAALELFEDRNMAGPITREALEIAQELNRRDANVPAWSFDLLTRARIYVAATSRREPASRQLAEVIQDLNDRAAAYPDRSSRWLAVAHTFRARLEEGDSQADWREVISLVSERSDPSIDLQLLLMEALFRTGAVDRARVVAGRLDEAGYHHPRFEALKKQLVSTPEAD